MIKILFLFLEICLIVFVVSCLSMCKDRKKEIKLQRDLEKEKEIFVVQNDQKDSMSVSDSSKIDIILYHLKP